MKNFANVTCPACFNSGVDISEEQHKVCSLCAGLGVVSYAQKMEWYAVRTLVIHSTLPIPSSLEQWRGYIEKERGK